MPHRCCVPTCRSNYNNEGQNVSMFSFPSDENLRERWVWNIKRENFVPTKHSRVCELHFPPSDVLRETSAFDEKKGKLIVAPLDRPRLKKGAIPCLFPNGPKYLDKDIATRESPEKKKVRREFELIKTSLEASMKSKDNYDARNLFNSLSELKKFLGRVKLPEFWTAIANENEVMLFKVTYANLPVMMCSLVINSELITKAFSKQAEIKVLKEYKFPLRINNILELEEILAKLDSSIEKFNEDDNITNSIHSILATLDKLKTTLPDKAVQIQFLSEQIEKLVMNKNRFRYSTDFIVVSSLLYSISSHAYKFLRATDFIYLPHPETIHRVCSSFGINPIDDDLHVNFLGYIRQKFNFLTESDKTVILMLDEIHLKSIIDFKGGKICGMSFNSSDSATSAHTFMIRSLLSSFQDVAHILPVNKLTAGELFLYIKKTIIGLEEIGFKVICVITDNNAINKKSMSLFDKANRVMCRYPHPSDAARPLFFLIDSVHLIKCIRNNWLNQKNSGQEIYFPNFDDFQNMLTAAFRDIKKLYEIENNQLVKYGYGLTMKALCPTNLEKQNVKLALQVFDNRICEALLRLGPSHHLLDHKGTAKFINIICTWWSIVNVKSPCKGFRKSDPYCEPLTSNPDDIRFSFLKKFICWLDSWKDKKCDAGTLTRETHEALKLTTVGITELTEYCLTELKFNYVLTGKLQTDVLENRFGKYRQLAGSQHHISIRQVYETENKLRLQSYLPKLASSSKGEIPYHFSILETDLDEDLELAKELLPPKLATISIHDSELNNITEMPLLTYIAGYCCYKIAKKLNCDDCKNSITIERELTIENDSYDWIRSFDRGLSYPHPDILNIVIHNYLLVKKLLSNDYESDFLKCTHHRNCVLYITTNVVHQKELFLDINVCSKHSKGNILKYLIRSSTNTFLNNYCKRSNDLILAKTKEKNLTSKNKTAARKLKTLTK